MKVTTFGMKAKLEQFNALTLDNLYPRTVKELAHGITLDLSTLAEDLHHWRIANAISIFKRK